MSRLVQLLAVSCSLSVPLRASAEEIWIGVAPFCAATPERCAAKGMDYVRSDKRGDKKQCVSGVKVLCRDFPENPKACTRLIGKAPLSPRREDGYTFVADNSGANDVATELANAAAPGPAREAFIQCVRACKDSYDAALLAAQKDKKLSSAAIFNAYILCSGRSSLTPPR